MADHSNIQHPEKEWRWLEYRQKVAHLETDLQLSRERAEALERELDAIFNRIAKGLDCDLCYPNGDVIRIIPAPCETGNS